MSELGEGHSTSTAASRGVTSRELDRLRGRGKVEYCGVAASTGLSFGLSSLVSLGVSGAAATGAGGAASSVGGGGSTGAEGAAGSVGTVGATGSL